MGYSIGILLLLLLLWGAASARCTLYYLITAVR